jgi:hypothetical protein
VDLDRLLLDALANEEGSDVLTLVALELNDLAHVLVVHHSAVACKLL